jgi:glycosyltransferase involved in cell wall biosynthesis
MTAVLTVILPVLNGMPYLREALASLETQTRRDFEVVLWDNGSTDGTVDEARRWIPSRLPGRVVTGQPLPLHLCLARMVEETKTEFCARMDADDVCLPRRFELELRYLEQNPAVSLVGCQIECIDGDGNRMPKEGWARYPVEHRDIVTQLLFNSPFSHPAILFRTGAVLQVGNYATPAPVEDIDLYLRLVQAFTVANLPSVELHYRLHAKSICAGAKVENRHENLAIAATAAQARRLFGIESATYLRLRHKTHPLSVWPLGQSAWYRSRKNRRRFISLVRSATFLFIGRCLTGKRDYVSKFVFKIIEMSVGRGP